MAGLILGLREAEPSAPLAAAIREGRVAGLLWFREAFRGDQGDVALQVERVRSLWPIGTRPIFAIDEEGGLIQQLSGIVERGTGPWPRLPSPRALGRADDEGLAFDHGREIGRRLRRIGIDATLAPLVDLDPGPASPVLGTRCLGSDPDRVAALALAWLRGLGSAGVRGCLKHYPGHGATGVDSHQDLPRVDGTVSLEPHIRPYRTIAKSWRRVDGLPPGILTAHLLVGGRPLPASLDRETVMARPSGLGPVFTDSLDMGALRAWGETNLRARLAAEAGSDFLVFGIDLEAGLAASRSIDLDPRGGIDAVVAQGSLPPVPEPMRPESLERIARAGVRIVESRPMPAGAWTWILPERFGPYGDIAPPTPQGPGGKRWIGRIIRCPGWDWDSLADTIRAVGKEMPILAGLVQRGASPHHGRVAPGEVLDGPDALVYLLDGPAPGGEWGIWRAESCGFGPAEIEAVRRVWSLDDGGNAD